MKTMHMGDSGAGARPTTRVSTESRPQRTCMKLKTALLNQYQEPVACKVKLSRHLIVTR